MKATQCLKMPCAKEGMGAAWRNSNFREGEELEPGTVDFSLAWFPVGHTVRFVSHGH